MWGEPLPLITLMLYLEVFERRGREGDLLPHIWMFELGNGWSSSALRARARVLGHPNARSLLSLFSLLLLLFFHLREKNIGALRGNTSSLPFPKNLSKQGFRSLFPSLPHSYLPSVWGRRILAPQGGYVAPSIPQKSFQAKVEISFPSNPLPYLTSKYCIKLSLFVPYLF